MRKIFMSSLILVLVLSMSAQDFKAPKPIKSGKIFPSHVATAHDFSISKPLRDLPPSKGARTKEELKALKKLKQQKEGLNFSMKYRQYPNASSAKPVSGDPARQSKFGWNKAHNQKAPISSFAGQDSPYSVSDCNGAAGPSHFMQGINTTYAIWDKQGNQLVAPTDFNTLFQGVDGANVNDGDPIVIYDDQADRWLAAEFSGAYSSPDYMLIAVSVTNDPTGEWYRWSFETNGFPDYMKFGIWRDGYYMGTNTGAGDDVYVFERDAMLAGETAPKMVAFDNPNRPNSGFHCIEPLDNDGDFAPEGTPGQFITINDDAWSGSSDQLWIYELNVDWDNLNNSTFERVQEIDVEPFDSDFGSSWANIAQQGTSQKVDAVPQILMYRTQYRNFGTHQTIVCAHSVDVDNTDHAGIRWYELQNTGSGWSIRQQSTYAPDEHSRWMPAISMDKNHNIAIGYNISSETMFPGIRYCGQSGAENAIASGFLDIAEETVLEGTEPHTSDERWADYAGMSIDPSDDETFWFTTEYANGGHDKSTRIVNFKFAPVVLYDNDAGAFALNMTSGTGFTNAETVEVVVRNYGTNPISNIPVSYQVDNGEIITEIIETTINVSEVYTHTFANTADLSSYGSYQFKIFTGLANDQNTANDTIIKTINHEEPSYCSASSGIAGYEHIIEVEFSDISNTSEEATYNDFTNIQTEVEKGETYELKVKADGAYSSDIVKAWIDWNHDYDFEDDGEEFTVGNGNSGTYSIMITIPEDAVNAVTRMRLRIDDTSNGSNQTPCGDSGYGEVEDYSVKIVNSVGIDVVSANNGLSVMPNPADSKIQISVEQNVTPLQIIDINGKVVYTFKSTPRNVFVVEISTWAEGVYILKYKNNKGKTDANEIVVKH